MGLRVTGDNPHSRTHLHAPSDVGARLADGVVSALGSWRFLIAQTVIVLAWITANVWLLRHPFDPYPLILLNLVFSTQAAYASPLILMAGNRAARRDRARDDLEASEVAQLWTMQQEQLEILRLLRQLVKEEPS